MSTHNQNVTGELQAKNNGELQSTGRSKPCTRAENLALGNTNPPEQQADKTTFRPREVVGLPVEVVVRPTLPAKYRGILKPNQDVQCVRNLCILQASPSEGCDTNTKI